MSDTHPPSLKALNATCAELLAATIYECYPQSTPLGIQVWDVCFCIEIASTVPFDKQALEYVSTQLHRAIAQNPPLEIRTMMKENAQAFFKKEKMEYMVQRLEEVETNLVELCRIGKFYDIASHQFVEASSIEAFALTDVEKIRQEDSLVLFRVYGAAFTSKEEAKKYTKQVNRVLNHPPLVVAHDMQLLSYHDEGCFIEPQGLVMWKVLEERIRKELRKNEFEEVLTLFPFPQGISLKRKKVPLFEEEDRGVSSDTTVLHTLLWEHNHAYSKIFEIGAFYRNTFFQAEERLYNTSYSLSARFHVICSEGKALQELTSVLKIFCGIASILDLHVVYSLVIPKKGSPKARSILVEALKELGCVWEERKSDMSLSGPKIEMMVQDFRGRAWPFAMLGIDGDMGEYVRLKKDMKEMVVIGGSVPISFERCIAFLLKKNEGELPLWIAPEQLRVIVQDASAEDAAQAFVQRAASENIRVRLNREKTAVANKIFVCHKQKVPFVAVIGKREAKDGTIMLRNLREKDSKEVLCTHAEALLTIQRAINLNLEERKV